MSHAVTLLRLFRTRHAALYNLYERTERAVSLVNKYIVTDLPPVPSMIDRNELFEDLKSWILTLPSVTQSPHRFGGTEFKVEGLEFMHHHGPSFLDIRLSKNDQATALKAGGAIPHRFAPQAGWVSFRIEKPEDLESAKKLIQLAYQNAKTSMEAHKISRGQSRLVGTFSEE